MGHDLNKLKEVSVNEFSDHFVVDFLGFREANGLTLQSLQVRAQVQILPLNALRKPRVSFGAVHLPIVLVKNGCTPLMEFISKCQVLLNQNNDSRT